MEGRRWEVVQRLLLEAMPAHAPRPPRHGAAQAQASPAGALHAWLGESAGGNGTTAGGGRTRNGASATGASGVGGALLAEPLARRAVGRGLVASLESSGSVEARCALLRRGLLRDAALWARATLAHGGGGGAR